MNRIGEEVERDPTYRGVVNAQRAEPEPTVGDDGEGTAMQQKLEQLYFGRD